MSRKLLKLIEIYTKNDTSCRVINLCKFFVAFLIITGITGIKHIILRVL